MPEVFEVKEYYTAVCAVDIGTVAAALLGERITERQRQTLQVDCPRHASLSHTSLHIWLDKQGWYCHGCGVGGDVLQLVEFVQSGTVTRGLSGCMPESHRVARDWLAAKVGLAPLAHCGLSADEIVRLEEQRTLALRSWECLTALTTLYHERLLASPEVLEWLRKQYAFGPEVVEAFRVGFAYTEGVVDALLAQGFTLRDLYGSGAFRPHPQHDEVAFPVFDARIIFPYLSRGSTVYLIARKTPWTPDADHERAKYKKLPVYDNTERPYIAEVINNGVLFNEDVLTTNPDSVIITEGITDCMTLIQQGFPAISPVTVQIRQADWEHLIPRLSRVAEVILCQDNEISEAGWKGALRTAHHLTLAKLRARIAVLPLDPPQQEARQQLVTRFGLHPGEGRAALQERMKQALAAERTAAQLLLEAAKQDVCGFFVAGHTAEEFRAVIAAAHTPLEYAIDSIPDGALTPALLRDIVSPILAQIAGLHTLEQTPLLKSLQAKLGKDQAPLGELRRAMQEEKKRQVKKIKHPPTPSMSDEAPPPMTDLGNAERLIQQHGDKLLFCTTSRSWLTWDGRRWTSDDHEASRRLAHETARSILKQEAASATDLAARDAWVDWQRKSESASATVNMLQQAVPYLAMPARAFDTDPWLLNVLNGTLDLRTGELRPHRRDHLIRKLVPVAYDPDATAPQWGQFLYRIFDGDLAMIDYIQRAVGYTLTGDVSGQSLFFMYGVGANGKSTFVETIMAMLGDYTQKAPTEMLMRKAAGANNVPNDLASLQGARMAVTSELDAGHRFSESRVKDITGGDTITARFLYGEFFQFTPTHKLWIYGNHKPAVAANDFGFWRRVHLIPFTVQIPEGERIKNFSERLRPQFPGILAWAVRGCQAWLGREQRLDPPDSIRAAVEEYRSDMDKLAQFFAECCHVVPGVDVQAKTLYDRYVTWCEHNHERMLSNTAFGRELTARGFTPLRRRDAIYRQGVTVRYE
ncbi:MAG: phage/plasmid primase, P4 family [Armatimonadota bacterium]